MSGKETLDGEQTDALEAVEQREQGIATWSARAVVIEAFTLTFVAEWGDRTQIATITLASSHHPHGVLLGAILGHAICAAIAVQTHCWSHLRATDDSPGGCLIYRFWHPCCHGKRLISPCY
nr:TMEM165/GDT1 family protein [Nodosilinea sp. LEGE 07088]